MSDLRYWIGFNEVRGIGPLRLRALLDTYGSIERAWHAPPEHLRSAGVDSRSVKNLLDLRSRISLDRRLEQIRDMGVHVLTWETPGYPPLLLETHAPPPVLYVKGELKEQDAWAVAVVGTRRASTYGREVTRRLAGDLARNGITVVSGMARGIDGVAHRAALEAGGRTIAVFGCGIDHIYPAEHRKLARQIEARGALISDYPLGTPPDGRNFPPRNRIISGLSLGVLVTNAGKTSGALITADFAAEQGRDVFAVPGSILTQGSIGPNRLIQDGAKLVTRAEDILEELNLTMVAEQKQARLALPEDETEAALLGELSAEPTHVDDLQQRIDVPISQITSALAMMELKGMVRQVGGMNYVIAREAGVSYTVE